MKLVVLGAGAWGTAISISLAPRHEVALWARNSAQARDIAATRVNLAYLPGSRIPDAVTVTADFAAALAGCNLILVATTTAGLRPTLKQLAASGNQTPLIWLCKGLDTDSAQLPHEVAAADRYHSGKLPPILRRVARGDYERLSTTGSARGRGLRYSYY